MDLKDIRNKIDGIDEKLLPLFLERMELSKAVAEYKKENNLSILNETREQEILKSVMEKSGEDMGLYACRLYSAIFELSREYQAKLIFESSDDK